MGGESPAQILVAHLRRQGIRDEVVLRALIRVPRELFIAQELRHLAYEDEALPLEEGQTISQPIVVATMTEALRVAPGQRVLEVGTGSGYQAAVLAEMGAEVVTVERRPRLANQARVLLCHLGYHNVTAHTGDGTLGWPQAAPYDRIIVTAATPAVPPALLEQLREGGRARSTGRSAPRPAAARHAERCCRSGRGGGARPRALRAPHRRGRLVRGTVPAAPQPNWT